MFLRPKIFAEIVRSYIRTVQCNRGFTLASRSDTVIVVHSLKGGSTAHALASVLHSWQTALDKGQSVGSSLVDFSKAVDRVNHNILLQKLLDTRSSSSPWSPQVDILIVFFWQTTDGPNTRKIFNLNALMELMIQGCLLGPLTFLVPIDGLASGCCTHKYVGCATLTKILTSATSDSHMPQWHFGLKNDFLIDTTKAIELAIGLWAQQHIILHYPGWNDTLDSIKRVAHFKLQRHLRSL